MQRLIRSKYIKQIRSQELTAEKLAGHSDVVHCLQMLSMLAKSLYINLTLRQMRFNFLKLQLIRSLAYDLGLALKIFELV